MAVGVGGRGGFKCKSNTNRCCIRVQFAVCKLENDMTVVLELCSSTIHNLPGNRLPHKADSHHHHQSTAVFTELCSVLRLHLVKKAAVESEIDLPNRRAIPAELHI